MSGKVVYRPHGEHACSPGWTWKPWPEDSDVPPPPAGARTGSPPLLRDFPCGTVWECECRSTWVSRGAAPTPVNMGYGAGMEPVEWKRESRRARRKRERQGVRPEQLWPGDYEVKPVPSLPTEVATLSVDELASLRAKFEKAQLDGRITVATPYTVEPYTESVDVPGGTVTFPFGITDEQAARVRDVFTKRHSIRLVLPVDRTPGEVASALIAGGISGRYFNMEVDPDGTEYVTVEDAFAVRAAGILSAAFLRSDPPCLADTDASGEPIAQWERDLLERQADDSCPAQQPADPVE